MTVTFGSARAKRGHMSQTRADQLEAGYPSHADMHPLFALAS